MRPSHFYGAVADVAKSKALQLRDAMSCKGSVTSVMAAGNQAMPYFQALKILFSGEQMVNSDTAKKLIDKLGRGGKQNHRMVYRLGP
jgi:hypothetical protein